MCSALPVETIQAGAACETFAEASASLDASASCYSSTEDVRILPIVVAESELSKIEREIFPTDVMEVAHNSALQERPERFDVIGMNLATDIDVIAMLDDLVRIDAVQLSVSRMFISGEQA